MKSTLKLITACGGPAFPTDTCPADGRLYAFPGMTLRDWFAGQIMMGVIANGGLAYADPGRTYALRLASEAYIHADAMLEARGRQMINLDVHSKGDLFRSRNREMWKLVTRVRLDIYRLRHMETGEPGLFWRSGRYAQPTRTPPHPNDLVAPCVDLESYAKGTRFAGADGAVWELGWKRITDPGFKTSFGLKLLAAPPGAHHLEGTTFFFSRFGEFHTSAKHLFCNITHRS